jgi:hypothetical protein
MVIYVFNTVEAADQLPPDAPPHSTVATSIEAAVQAAASSDEIRLVHGPFVCKPLIFEGKSITLKGIGRRTEGPGRRVIVIFTTHDKGSSCITVSDGHVSLEECVLVDSSDGEHTTMSSVQARIKMLDRAMGRHPWQRDHDSDRQNFVYSALQSCGALFNELQRICQWEKSSSFVMENECSAASHRLLRAGMLQCGDMNSVRADHLLAAAAASAADARNIPPLLHVISGHLQLCQCEFLHRSPHQISLQGDGGSCVVSASQSLFAAVASGTFKLTLSRVRMCTSSTGASAIKAANESHVIAEDCVICSGITLVAAGDNSTLALHGCSIYDAQVRSWPAIHRHFIS